MYPPRGINTSCIYRTECIPDLLSCLTGRILTEGLGTRSVNVQYFARKTFFFHFFMYSLHKVHAYRERLPVYLPKLLKGFRRNLVWRGLHWKMSAEFNLVQWCNSTNPAWYINTKAKLSLCLIMQHSMITYEGVGGYIHIHS